MDSPRKPYKLQRLHQPTILQKRNLVVGQKYNGILIEGYLCSSCCVGCSEKQCIFDYSYQAEGGAIIRNSVAVASNISNISNLVSRAVNSVKNISRR